MVFPWRTFLAGDAASALALVQACHEACGAGARLKVILETGQLGIPARIREAADIAIAGGAHFLKTSTGKTQPGATLMAAQIMLDAIAAARMRGVEVGFKASGGIRTGGCIELPGGVRATVWRRQCAAGKFQNWCIVSGA